MELIRQQRFDEAEKEMKHKRREVRQAKKRIAELDRIFKRIYEDDINGKRFQKVDIVFNFVGEIHFPTEPQTEAKVTEKQEKTA